MSYSDMQMIFMAPQLVLGGEVGSVFTYKKEVDYAAAVEAARLEQEAICGYPLRVIKTRQTKTADINGNAVYEVYATFGPLEEEPPLPQPFPE